MKKSLKFYFLLLVLFLLVSCKEEVNYQKIIQKAEESIVLLNETKEDLELKTSIEIDGYVVNVSWESNNDAISSSGVVTRKNEDTLVILKANFSLNGYGMVKEYNITVLKKDEIKIDYKKIINDSLDKFIIKTQDNKLVLPQSIINGEYEINLTYEVKDSCIDSEYNILPFLGSKNITIEVFASLSSETVSKVYTLNIEGIDISEFFLKAYKQVEQVIPEKITTRLEGGVIVIDGIDVSYSFEGDFERNLEEEKEIMLTISLNALGEDFIGTKIISVKSYLEEMEEIVNEIIIPEETNENITLIKNYGGILLNWSSSNTRVLTDKGEVKYVKDDTIVTLTLNAEWELSEDILFIDKEYQVTIKPFSLEKCFELVLQKISMPTEVSDNFYLYNESIYDVNIMWSSSDESVITNDGKVYQDTIDRSVTLTLTLSKDGNSLSYSYDILVKKFDLDGCDKYINFHNYTDDVTDFNIDGFDNVELKDGFLVLKDDALSGVYTSYTFKTKNIYEVVGSYSCISSKNATGNLEISLRVGGVWSKYVSYGDYGLGRENLYYNQENDLIKIATDEIKVNNNKTADAIRYRFTMKRDNLSTQSPKLTNVSFAFYINNYEYNANLNNISNKVIYDVPKLYQHDVPTIGSSICSATTTTMLLKYLGYDFSNKGYTYEHEYMAQMVADRGHNNPTYGNWSYNMITAGAFGAKAKVYKIYSLDEVIEQLNTIGPVGLSISGTITGIREDGSSHTYTTGGHLVCVRGYEIVNGVTYFILNDPNVYGVYYKVLRSTLENVTRNITYVVTK